jgi:hypothetical protein
MALTPELRAEIENEVSALNKRDFRRPGTSMNGFIDEYSGILAQAVKDQTALVAAGFDWSRMDKYNGYLEMLSQSYGERLGTTPVSPEMRVQFDVKLSLAQKDRRQLGIVASYIVEQTDNHDVRRNYRHIAQGSGTMDTLTDNLGLVAMIREFPQLASQIRPGGVLLDDPYLEAANIRAIELLRMKGIVVDRGVVANGTVDRQNRLLTLCLRARTEIRTFAAAAFFDDVEYYNRNYASPSTRTGNEPVVASVPLSA